MADHETHVPAMDNDEHRQTYERFIAGVKYVIGGIVLTLVLMVLFL